MIWTAAANNEDSGDAYTSRVCSCICDVAYDKKKAPDKADRSDDILNEEDLLYVITHIFDTVTLLLFICKSS